MALKVNCNRCANPECDGREYRVDYDYHDGPRKQGSKIVCSSQVYEQGNRTFHVIKTATHVHKFEAELVQPPEEVEVEHTVETNFPEAGQEFNRENARISEDQNPPRDPERIS